MVVKDQFVAIRAEFPGEPGRTTAKVTCPDEGVALRGSHSERFVGTGARVVERGYDRNSFSVTYEAFSSINGHAVLSVRCLTAPAP